MISRDSSRFATILGIGQMPSKARYDDLTFPQLISAVCARALADADLEEQDLGGIVLGLAPDLLLGTSEAQYLAAGGLADPRKILGRVHTAAGSGLSAFRLACAHACGTVRKPVLAVSADLGSQAVDHAKVIWQMLDPIRERHVPMNGVSLFALMSSTYMHAYEATERQLAQVIVKNRANGATNPFAQLRETVTLDQVLASAVVAWPIRQLEVGPAGGGAAAVVVAPPDSTNSASAVDVLGLGACAGNYSIGDRLAMPDIDLITLPALVEAARRAYQMAGIGAPETEIGLAEVYASYPIVELTSIEALGLAKRGHAAIDVAAGRFDSQGSLPINRSGGATCGNPLSATSLLRLVELVRQLRAPPPTGQRRAGTAGVASGFGGASQLHEVVVVRSRT